jgi:chloramphenicol 3-O phosphotransferase
VTATGQAWPDIIVLNGPTSAGKTSLTAAVQALAPCTYLSCGIDDAFARLPARLHHSDAGFVFSRDARGEVWLDFGAEGWDALEAHVRGWQAMAAGGGRLILDEVLIWPRYRARVEDALNALQQSGRRVLRVAVRCEPDELDRREVARGDRRLGQARGQVGLVLDGWDADLVLDSTGTSPGDLAAAVAAWVASPRTML